MVTRIRPAIFTSAVMAVALSGCGHSSAPVPVTSLTRNRFPPAW